MKGIGCSYIVKSFTRELLARKTNTAKICCQIYATDALKGWHESARRCQKVFLIVLNFFYTHYTWITWIRQAWTYFNFWICLRQRVPVWSESSSTSADPAGLRLHLWLTTQNGTRWNLPISLRPSTPVLQHTTSHKGIHNTHTYTQFKAFQCQVYVLKCVFDFGYFKDVQKPD